MQPLDDAARAWVDLQKALMHRHTAKAVDASNEWNQLNAELMAKFRAEGRTDLEIARVKGANLALNDLYGAYQFHAAKASMHAAVLQAELAARQLLADEGSPAGHASDTRRERTPRSGRPGFEQGAAGAGVPAAPGRERVR
ncbi:hypothetical protein [Micromonospora endolithica]|uniref:hypothetical protein n=1 Tax=Micromonospora endolithica TaxID=230091 RepID=UPI0011AC2EE4|nr:hypothetical protein [Micromonospora endolithica]TWJ23096.1 hypothetical protein JD76_03225 [Micromonospora endolithica]